MRSFVVVIVVALHLHAYADPTEDAALLHLDRGVTAFNAKDFATAEREFTAAHQLVPDKANPYRWLALTEIQLGDCKSALEHIDGFIRRVPPADPRVAEMTRWREFCRREAAQPSGAETTTPTTQPTGTQATTQVTGTQATTQVTGTQGLAAAPAPRDKPLRQRWWFWPAIGTAAVAITGVTVYALTRSDGTMLPPITCSDAGCAR
jgi:hypothetical protein